MSKRVGTAKWYEKYQRWQIKVQKNGQRRTFTSSDPTRNGQWAANRQADQWLDDEIVSDKIFVSTLYEGYYEVLKLRYGQSGLEKEDYFWRCHVGPAIGNKRIRNVSELDLQHIIDKAYHDGRSKKTLKGLASFIRSFMRHCRKAKATTLEPDLSIPKNAPVGTRTILQPSALVVLLNSANTTYRGKVVFDENIFAYRFAVFTGLRPGELRHLRWSDIKGNHVYVRGSINVKKQATNGKNNNAVRRFKMIALAADTLRELEQHIGAHAKDEPVFCLPTNNGFYKQWHRYCDTNNIPKISLYEMRHTFVSISKRLEEGKIKTLVGHAKDMDTLGIYSHEMDGDDQLTADELNDVFKKVLAYGEKQAKNQNGL